MTTHLTRYRPAMSRFIAALFALAFAHAAFAQSAQVPFRTGHAGLVTFPDAQAYCPQTDDDVYASCGEQRAVLSSAIAAAQTSHRRVLMIVGADWCTWCHILERTLEGELGAAAPADPQLRADADTLARFAAERFVVARINVEAQQTTPMMARFGVSARTLRVVPQVYVVSEDGRRVRVVDTAPAELPRGYDRTALRGVLTAAMR